MVAAAADAIRSGAAPEDVQKALAQTASSTFQEPQAVRGALVRGWQSALDTMLEDSVLSESEEHQLFTFAEKAELTQTDLNVEGAWERAVKATVLRDILDGTPKQRMTVVGSLPFNFKRGEVLIWVFPSTRYYEQRTQRQYVGGSHGASVRVMKGVYYRVGAFRGQPIDTQSIVEVDSGHFALTDQNVYFAGAVKSLRIPYPKIVSFAPFSDGIGLHRDAAAAKPQFFVTGDGWFTYNAVVNLAKMP